MLCTPPPPWCDCSKGEDWGYVTDFHAQQIGLAIPSYVATWMCKFRVTFWESLCSVVKWKQRLCLCNKCFLGHLKLHSYCCSSLCVHLKHQGRSSSQEMRCVCVQWVALNIGADVAGVVCLLPLKHSTAGHSTLLLNAPSHFCTVLV